MNARGLAVCAGIVLTAGLVVGLAAQSSAPKGRITLDSHRFVGTPRSFRNLTLIPIYAPKAKATNAYITLDEGLKAKTVTVREATGGGEVNKLFIRNKSGKILYILAGEVVLGGQQDRSLGTDTVIPPDEKEVPVTAFCVEHGRWSGKVEFDKSAMAVVSADVRSSAQEGAFVAARPPALSGIGRNAGGGAGEQIVAQGNVAQQEANVTVQPGRAAQQRVSNQRANALSARAPAMTVGRAQQEVWDKVASKNRRFKAESATGTYRGVLEGAAGEVQQNLAPYLKAFEKGLGSDPQLVGVMAAVNGKVVTADIFGDPGLFRKLWPKLLRSYAADAAELSTAPEAKKPKTVTAQTGRDFFAAAMDTKEQAVNRSTHSDTLRLESKTARLYRYDAKGKALPAGGLGGGGFGGSGGGAGVHTNIIGK